MNRHDEQISHPVLAAVFKSWEDAAMDFCADQEASLSGREVSYMRR
jgi:hypothetical protein